MHVYGICQIRNIFAMKKYIFLLVTLLGMSGWAWGQANVQVDVFNVTCSGANDGKIVVTVNSLPGDLFPARVILSGGGLPQSQTVSSAGGSVTFSPLTPGNNKYTVQVLNKNNLGVYTASNLSIIEPDELLIPRNNGVVPTLSDCQKEGSVTLRVSGGTVTTQGYTYTLTGLSHSYTHQTTSTSYTFPTVLPDTYTVEIVDENGCSVTAPNPVVMTHYTPMVASVVDSTGVQCYGDSNGTATLSITGGRQPYFIYLNNDFSGYYIDEYFIDLPQGINYFEIWDATYNLNCTVTLSVEIEGPDNPLSIQTITPTDVMPCAGDDNGQIFVQAAGGTSLYKYSYSGNGSSGSITGATATFSPLKAGTYTISVTDAMNCPSVTGSATINEPKKVTFTTDAVDNTCAGTSEGKIEAHTTSYADMQYKLQQTVGGNLVIGYAADSVFTGLKAGKYLITAKNSIGCESDPVEVEIKDPDPIKITTAVVDSVSCNGGNDGAIAITASGGKNGNLSYAISPTVGSNEPITNGIRFKELTKGFYTIVITDNDDPKNPKCSKDTVIEIKEPLLIVIDNIIVGKQDMDCFGDTTHLRVVAHGQPGRALEYLLTKNGTSIGWQDSPVFRELEADNTNPYTVHVRYKAYTACGEVTMNKSITQPNKLDVSENMAQHQDVQCYGLANGTAGITILGGTPIYDVIWSNGRTGTYEQNLAGGTYKVKVIDARGCQDSVQIVITPAQPIAIAIDTTAVSCYGGNDGTATITVSGGNVGQYKYELDGGPRTNITVNPFTLSGLTSKVYALTILDDENCTKDTTFLIPTPQALVIDSIGMTAVTCYNGADGTLKAYVLGGIPPYNYQWTLNGTAETFSGQTITGLKAGIYTLSVTDSKCAVPVTSSKEVKQPAELKITVADTVLTCVGDIAQVKALVLAQDPGLTVEFSMDQTDWSKTIFPLTKGTYILYARYKEKGTACVPVVRNFSVIDPLNPLQLSVAVDNPPMCHEGTDGKATASVVGGVPAYTYAWYKLPNKTTPIDGNVTTKSNLSGGNYFVTVQDGNGCRDTAYFGITPVNPIKISIDTTAVSCYGGNDGTATITVSGGNVGQYKYELDGGSRTDITVNPFTLSTLTSKTYTLSIFDDKGCQKDTTFYIPSKTRISFQLDSTDVTCFGGTDGSITISNISGGSRQYKYQLDGGAYIDLPATGVTIPNLPAKTYTVTVSDASSATCMESQTIAVIEPGELKISVADTILICVGDIAQVKALVVMQDPNLTVEFSMDQTDWSKTIFPLTKGTYILYARYKEKGTACAPVVRNFSVIDPLNPLQLSVAVDNPPMCHEGTDGKATVSVVGGVPAYTYAWYKLPNKTIPIDGNVTTKSNLSGGNYFVTVQDGNGCRDTAYFDITPVSSVTATIDSTDITCAGLTDGTITISNPQGGNGAAYTYEVKLGVTIISTNPAQTAYTGLGAGQYTIVVYDKSNCPSETYTATINDKAPLSFRVDSVNATCFGTTDGSIIISNVTGGSGQYKYQLDGGALTDLPAAGLTISNLSAKTYTVTVSDAASVTCSLSKNITIDQPGKLAIDRVDGVTDMTCAGEEVQLAIVLSDQDTDLQVEYSMDGTHWQLGNVFILGKGIYTPQVQYVGIVPTCVDTYANIEVKVPDTIQFTVYVDKYTIDCNINEKANITVSAIGGLYGNYEYSFDGGVTWQPTNTLNTGTGLYKVCVRDADAPNCSVCSDQPYVINGLTGITVTATAARTMLDCAGDKTSITVSVAESASTSNAIEVTYNGTNWYTITKDKDTTFNNIPAGTYYVLARYKNTTCSSSSPEIKIEAPDAVVAVFDSQTDAAGCNSEVAGTVTISVTGGTAPYQYQVDGNAPWKPLSGTSPFTIDDLVEGNHEITIIDSKACAAVPVTVDINNPDALKILTAQVNVRCFGESSGEITVKVNQGEAPYQVLITALVSGKSWTHTLNAAGEEWNLTGLDADLYTIQVTDNKGCKQQTSAQIRQPVSPLSLTVTPHNICPGETLGGYYIKVEGGWSPWQLNWYYNSSMPDNYTVMFPDGSGDPKNESPEEDNLKPGFYRVITWDKNMCSDTAEFEIVYMPNYPIYNKIQPYGVKCNKPATGSIKVTPSGGLGGPYMYRLRYRSNNTTVPGYDFKTWANDSITGLNEGKYYIDMLDIQSPTCTPVIDTVSVGKDPGLIIHKIEVEAGNCHGDLSNITNIVVTGSDEPLEYKLTWSGGTIGWKSTPVFNNLVDAVYTVDVRVANDPGGCSATKDTTISAPAAIVITAVTNKMATCDDPNGNVAIIAQGGTGDLALSFNGTPVAGTLIDATLNKWSYNQPVNKGGKAIIEVVDEHLCSEIDTIQIPYTPGLNFIQKDSTLNECPTDTKASITALVENVDPLATSVSFTYELYIGSVTTGTPFLSITKGPGKLTEPAVFDNLPNGTYTVSVYDPTPCYSDDWTLVIDNTNKVTLEDTLTVGNTCLGKNDGRYLATIVGDASHTSYDYELNGDASTRKTVAAIGGWADIEIDNLSAGNYTLTIYYDQCSVDEIFIIKSKTALVPQSVTPVDVTGCYGAETGAIDIVMSSASGRPYKYWYNKSAAGAYTDFSPKSSLTARIPNLAAGTYAVVVQEATGCMSDTIRRTIADAPRLQIDTTVLDPITCKGSYGRIEISIQGGSGLYKVEVAEKPDAIALEPVITGSGSVFELSQITGGLYRVAIEDLILGCVDTLDLDIDAPRLVKIEVSTSNWCADPNVIPEVYVHVITPAPASGNYFRYSCTGLNDVETSDSDYTFAGPFTNGQYTISVVDLNSPNGCLADTVIQIVLSPVVTIKETKTPIGNCVYNVDLTVEVSGGTAPYQYSNDGGATFQSSPDYLHVSSNSYRFMVKDNNGCISKIVPYSVSLPKPIRIDYRVDNTTCNTDGKGGIRIEPKDLHDNYTYEWFGDVRCVTNSCNVVDKLNADDYRVIITNTDGCSLDTTFHIGASYYVEVKITVDGADVRSFCPGTQVVLNGAVTINGVPFTSSLSGAYANWILPNGDTKDFLANNPLILDATNGIVELVASSNNCSNSDTIHMSTKPVPTFVMVDTVYIPRNETYTLQVDAQNFATYSWTSVPAGYANGLPMPPASISLASPDVPYTLTLTLTSALPDQCSVSGTVFISRALDFFIPNAFTPNDDGIHDKWIFTNLEQYSSYYSVDVAVFNRAGVQVYEGKGYNNSSVVFDGRRNGNDLPIGTYYYVVKVGPNTFTGSVTIIR